MTYGVETKNITFHVIHVKVSRDFTCSRTLPMNVAIESAHCGCETNSCKDSITCALMTCLTLQCVR